MLWTYIVFACILCYVNVNLVSWTHEDYSSVKMLLGWCAMNWKCILIFTLYWDTWCMNSEDSTIIFVKAGGENGFMCTVRDLSLSAKPLEGEKEISHDNHTKKSFAIVGRCDPQFNNSKIFIPKWDFYIFLCKTFWGGALEFGGVSRVISSLLCDFKGCSGWFKAAAHPTTNYILVPWI